MLSRTGSKYRVIHCVATPAELTVYIMGYCLELSVQQQREAEITMSSSHEALNPIHPDVLNKMDPASGFTINI